MRRFKEGNKDLYTEWTNGNDVGFFTTLSIFETNRYDRLIFISEDKYLKHIITRATSAP